MMPSPSTIVSRLDSRRRSLRQPRSRERLPSASAGTRRSVRRRASSLRMSSISSRSRSSCADIALAEISSTTSASAASRRAVAGLRDTAARSRGDTRCWRRASSAGRRRRSPKRRSRSRFWTLIDAERVVADDERRPEVRLRRLARWRRAARERPARSATFETAAAAGSRGLRCQAPRRYRRSSSSARRTPRSTVVGESDHARLRGRAWRRRRPVGVEGVAHLLAERARIRCAGRSARRARLDLVDDRQLGGALVRSRRAAAASRRRAARSRAPRSGWRRGSSAGARPPR